MENFNTNNPTLKLNSFIKASQADNSSDLMTVSGVINKTTILFGLLGSTAVLSWNLAHSSYAQIGLSLGVVSLVIGAGLAFFTIFRPQVAHITAPIYALCQGLALGNISVLFESTYNGIVSTSILLTCVTLVAMLLVYKTGLIKVNQTFYAVLLTAMSGIAIIYAFNLITMLFGASLGLFQSSNAMGIGFSLFVVGIAALNLVMDFDRINSAIESGMATKRAEWYAGFSLMITLVWLYVEILNLLAKLNRRK